MAGSSQPTAFLTLDLQEGILSASPESSIVLKPVQRALSVARQRNYLILHVGLGFTISHAEVPDHARAFKRAKDHNLFVRRTPSSEFVSGLTEPHEAVVHKQRISAFAENSLQMILRSQQIRHLVLCGVSSSGVVLSTVRQAADLDYELTVLRDGCWDADAEVQKILMDKIFPKQARVCRVQEWALQSSAGD